MDLSSSAIAQMKTALQSGNNAVLIEYMTNSSDYHCLDVVKRNKLLLFAAERKSLFDVYREAIKRILPSDEDRRIEENYLKFIENYLLETRNYREEIERQIEELFPNTAREFLFLVGEAVVNSISRATSAFYDDLEQKLSHLSSIPEQSQLNEYAHNLIKGRLLDTLFAATNLVNLFSEHRGDLRHSHAEGQFSDQQSLAIYELLMLSSKINSWQFALDNLSYGEWNCSWASPSATKTNFRFEFIDFRFQKARELGLRRIVSDQYIPKKTVRWLRVHLENIASEVFECAWDYFNSLTNIVVLNRNDYSKAKEQVLGSMKWLKAEDDLLSGTTLGSTDVMSTYISGFVLYTYANVAQFLKPKSSKYLFQFSNPKIFRSELDKVLNKIVVLNQDVQNKIDCFITDLPVDHHLKLFDAPFVKDDENNVVAIDILCLEDWTKWVKCQLMRGGKNADIVGKTWEDYIASVLVEHKWNKVVKGVKLKRDGKLITDIDIVGLWYDTLIVMQIKIWYGNGVNGYEQWKFKEKLQHGVTQVKKSEDAIKSNLQLLGTYFDEAELSSVTRIQSLVMTNSHMFNGRKYEDVPIMSFGSLIQLFNGATVKFQTASGQVVYEKKYIESHTPTVNDFIEFLEKPLDWRITEPVFETRYHQEEFQHSVLEFPLLEDKDANDYRKKMMAGIDID